MEENSFENGTELAELFNRSELARIRNGSLPSLKAARNQTRTLAPTLTLTLTSTPTLTLTLTLTLTPALTL